METMADKAGFGAVRDDGVFNNVSYAALMVA